MISDDFENHTAETTYHLKTSEIAQPYELRLSSEAPANLKTGDQVRVTGIQSGDEILVNEDGMTGGAQVRADFGPPVPVVGSKRILVLLVNFQNDTLTPYTRDQVHNAMFADPKSVAAYYLENSFGQLGFSGDVADWFTIPIDKGDACAIWDWGDLADQKAREQGIVLENYDYRMYVLGGSSIPCSFGGIAEVYGTRSWIVSFAVSILAHEIGHNLGVRHASTLHCEPLAVDDYANCSTVEYGDYSDVMASGNTRHFNGAHKYHMGWFPPENIAQVSESGIYTIKPLEDAQNGIQVVKILKDQKLGDYYYVSYRAPVGFDQGLAQQYLNGASVHLGNEMSYLIDTRSDTSTMNDAPLKDGGSFGDGAAGIKITQLSHDSNGTTVRIDFGAIGGAPQITGFSPAGDIIMNEGTLQALSLTAQDPDGDALVYWWEVDGLLLSGINVNTSSWTYAPDASAGGATHVIRARAVDPVGLNASQAWNVTVQDVFPDDLAAPSALTAVHVRENSDDDVVLAWQDHSDNELGFKIERSLDGLTFREVTSVGPNTTTYRDDAFIVEEKMYHYRIRAHRGLSRSAYSNIAVVSTQKPLGPAIQLSATAISSTQINLTWLESSFNEDGLEVQISQDGVSFTPIVLLTPDTESFQATGLQPGASYYFRVRTFRQTGEPAEVFSSVIQVRTLELVPSPSGLTATAVSGTKIKLLWQDQSPVEQGFLIERSVDGEHFLEVGNAGPNITIYQDQGLTFGSEYHYRVRAYQLLEFSEYSNVATRRIVSPAAPVNLTATAVSNTGIDLAWEDRSSDESGFKIERSMDGINFTTIKLVGTNAQGYRDRNLLSSRIYYYRVRAYNGIGPSDYSDIASATTWVNHAPVLNAIGTKRAWTGETLMFTLSATDQDGDSLTYTMENAPSGATLLAKGGVFTWSVSATAPEMEYSVKFQVSDGQAVDSETVIIAVLKNDPPAITYLTNYKNYMILWNGLDPEDAQNIYFSYRVDQDAWSAPVVNRLISISSISTGLAYGTHTFQIKAIDPKGLESPPSSVSFAIWPTMIVLPVLQSDK